MELLSQINDEIVNCLEAELLREKSGFHCNWNSIATAINKDRALFFSKEKRVVGFVTYTEYEEYVQIDLFEILEKYRGQGMGLESFNLILEYFKRKNKSAFMLFCEPTESYNFWTKCGFNDFPEEMHQYPKYSVWRAIFNQPDSNKWQDDNRLELWNVEPHQSKDRNATWAWSVHEINNGNKLIHPAHYDWNLRWVKKGEIVKDSKVKYFTKVNDELVQSPFIVISHLSIDNV